MGSKIRPRVDAGYSPKLALRFYNEINSTEGQVTRRRLFIFDDDCRTVREQFRC